MDERCPLCWSPDVGQVALFSGRRAGDDSRRLMECRECERWYLADSGEEVPRLFEICVTPLLKPHRCPEDVREVMNSGGSAFPRRRAAEFNRLCSDCLNSRFLAERIAAHA